MINFLAFLLCDFCFIVRLRDFWKYLSVSAALRRQSQKTITKRVKLNESFTFVKNIYLVDKKILLTFLISCESEFTSNSIVSPCLALERTILNSKRIWNSVSIGKLLFKNFAQSSQKSRSPGPGQKLVNELKWISFTKLFWVV